MFKNLSFFFSNPLTRDVVSDAPELVSHQLSACLLCIVVLHHRLHLKISNSVKFLWIPDSFN